MRTKLHNLSPISSAGCHRLRKTWIWSEEENDRMSSANACAGLPSPCEWICCRRGEGHSTSRVHTGRAAETCKGGLCCSRSNDYGVPFFLSFQWELSLWKSPKPGGQKRLILTGRIRMLERTLISRSGSSYVIPTPVLTLQSSRRLARVSASKRSHETTGH